ncbi:hypothetical protein [Cetobacterium sp.]|uniref:hypothetical protein n=1 Tax=Cetobacterium sp. TaxID=2071632 RepID=UPI003EE45769
MKKFLFVLFSFFYVNIFANYKILNKEIIPKMKYSVDFEVSIIDGKFPTEENMKQISYNEKINNPGYENYFIHFYLPGMKLGSGAFAVSNNYKNSNSEMEVEIWYDTLLYNPNYSDKVKKDSKNVYYLENYNNKLEKNSNKIETLEKVGAKILIDYHTVNGKLNIQGFSNLPKGMELLIDLENIKTNYKAQESIVILDDGSFFCGPFSEKNYRLKSGEYNLIISSPISFVQSQNVQKIIGEKGESLKSDITIEDDGYFFIEYKKKIII